MPCSVKLNNLKIHYKTFTSRGNHLFSIRGLQNVIKMSHFITVYITSDNPNIDEDQEVTELVRLCELRGGGTSRFYRTKRSIITLSPFITVYSTSDNPDIDEDQEGTELVGFIEQREENGVGSRRASAIESIKELESRRGSKASLGLFWF